MLLDLQTSELQTHQVDYDVIEEKIGPLSYRQAILLRAALDRYLPERQYDLDEELTIQLPDESLTHIELIRSVTEFRLAEASEQIGNRGCSHLQIGQILIEAEYKMWGDVKSRVKAARSNPERKEV